MLMVPHRRCSRRLGAGRLGAGRLGAGRLGAGRLGAGRRAAKSFREQFEGVRGRVETLDGWFLMPIKSNSYVSEKPL